jgi:hypothetical protein
MSEVDRRVEALRSELDQREIELLMQKDAVRVAERKARHSTSHVAYLQETAITTNARVEQLETELLAERTLRHKLEAQQREHIAKGGQIQADADAELYDKQTQLARLEAALVEARRVAFTAQEKLSWEHEEAKVRTAELERLQAIEVKHAALLQRVQMLEANNTVQVLADLQWENASLLERVQELESQLHTTHAAGERDQDILTALQQDLLYERQQRRNADAGGDFENMSEVIESDFPLPRDQEVIVSPPPPPPPAAASSSSSVLSPAAAARSQEMANERDAAQEFFSLTMLAVRLNFGQKLDSLSTVTTQALWQRAKETKVQFYEYYAWIEEQLTLAYVADVQQTAAPDATSCNTAALARARLKP